MIRANLAQLFPDVEIVGAHLFRVIRDAGVEALDDSGDDLLESVDRTLKQIRHAPPSLLQVEAAMPRRVVKTLVDNFEISDNIVVRSNERLDLADWMALHRLPLPHLKDRPFVAAGGGIHSAIPACSTISAAGLPRRSALRVVCGGRNLHSAGGDRPVGRRDQDDALSVGANSPIVDMLIPAAKPASKSRCWWSQGAF